jgi:hypothetical protein
MSNDEGRVRPFQKDCGPQRDAVCRGTGGHSLTCKLPLRSTFLSMSRCARRILPA